MKKRHLAAAPEERTNDGAEEIRSPAGGAGGVAERFRSPRPWRRLLSFVSSSLCKKGGRKCSRTRSKTRRAQLTCMNYLTGLALRMFPTTLFCAPTWSVSSAYDFSRQDEHDGAAGHWMTSGSDRPCSLSTHSARHLRHCAAAALLARVKLQLLSFATNPRA
jgi:hypothetical protein